MDVGEPPKNNANSPLKFWIDAQLPPLLARWLRADLRAAAIHVEELELLQASDAAIFQAARDADHAVVLLTKDEDFRRLIGQRGPPPQVIWLRCGNVTNPELRRILLGAWPQVAALLEAGEPLVEVRRRGPLAS